MALKGVHVSDVPTENASFSLHNLLHTYKRSIGTVLAMFKDRILAVAGILSNMACPTPPLLPVANPPPSPPTPHPTIQTMQNLELGKLLLTLAPNATLGGLLAAKFDSAAGDHPFIISGMVMAFTFIWNGTLLGTTFPRLGSILESLGITLVLLSFFGLVATFLSGGFSLICWLSGAFCVTPFIYAAITAQQAAA